MKVMKQIREKEFLDEIWDPNGELMKHVETVFRKDNNMEDIARFFGLLNGTPDLLKVGEAKKYDDLLLSIDYFETWPNLKVVFELLLLKRLAYRRRL